MDNNGFCIYDSYKIWSYSKMKHILKSYTIDPKNELNRTYVGMIVEWYIHNIGYYLTLPFCASKSIAKLNERFKHTNLEAHHG